MNDDARRTLAAEHRRLLDALAGGPVPPGFDAARVALAGHALLAKRRRSVERTWPALAAVPGFAERFANYAAVTPLPSIGGAAADGRLFLAMLDSEGGLTDEALLEWLRVRAADRGVAIARLDGAPRWAIAVRLPWPGRRVWVVAT